MKAEIIAVGSELLTPDRLDTNSLFLTEELNAIGIEVVRKTVVGDNRELLAEAFRDALNRVPLIIASGGLGPTEDDLTRETVADLLGRKLRRNDEILRYIEGRFRKLGREMPEVNVRQAMVPEGAEILENPHGTAPGLWLEDANCAVVLLPGPPRELKPLFREQVLPRLHAVLERLAPNDLNCVRPDSIPGRNVTTRNIGWGKLNDRRKRVGLVGNKFTHGEVS